MSEDTAGPIENEVLETFTSFYVATSRPMPAVAIILARHLDSIAKRITLMEAFTSGVSELDVEKALREEEGFDKRLGEVETTIKALEESVNTHLWNS